MKRNKKKKVDYRMMKPNKITGPDHAFGDLIAASGITYDMLDSLMALKDLDDVPGLSPLSTVEDMLYEINTRKSTRADIERQKQEEIANARVRQVDSQGRPYGTGKRKCSIARVWIEPGQIGAIRLGMSRAGTAKLGTRSVPSSFERSWFPDKRLENCGAEETW